MNKLAIVGCEASGKTVFMSALADAFRSSLIPENAAANRFARFAARQLRSLRQWPPATNPGKAVEMVFSLRDQGLSLATFGLLEFGGETFRAAFREDDAEPVHRQSVKALMDFLSDADFILVLVSLKELLRDPGNVSFEDFERDTESIWVTRGLLEFIREKIPGAGLAIGLTQADRYSDALAAAGSAADLFATRWPSIRALAPDVPVLAVASVSATDDEGRPAENFSTEGIFPVLAEFARQQFGTPEALLAELTALRKTLETPPEALCSPATLSAHNRAIKTATTKLEDLRRACVLSRTDHAAEIAVLADALDRAKDVNRSRRTHQPRTSRKKSRAPAVRRPFLYALLGAAVVLLSNQHIAPVLLHRSGDALPGKSAKPPVVITKIVTNVVTKTVTNVITNTITNVVAQLPPVAVTNTPSAVAPTNNIKVVTRHDYRTWHDHKGKPIEAEWISTSIDQKSITLRTPNGRIIRAVLYKLSEEDRKFVQDKLSK